MRHSKAERRSQRIGQAGNDARRPKRYPVRGIKGKASKERDSCADSGRKSGPNKGNWPFRRGSRSDAPKPVEKGIETRVAKRNTESLAETERRMEEVCERENCKQALQRVKANQGSPGVDGMTVEELSEYLKQQGQEIGEQLRSGTYQPRPVKRVEIPKPDGGGSAKVRHADGRFIMHSLQSRLGYLGNPA